MSVSQGTKGKGLVLNPPKKLVVDCYDDAFFAWLWRHKNPQDPLSDRSRTIFVVTFINFTLLWVSKLQIYISLYIQHSEYVVLYNYIRELNPLKSIIKEVIYNLVMDSEEAEVCVKFH